jgi:threonine-phosphate decarboxylase
MLGANRLEMNMYKHGGDIYSNKNTVDFSTNINLAGIPEGVIRAACEGVIHSDRYPDTEYFDLRNAISQAKDIPMEQIICGNGAADLIYSLVLALKPKKALIPVPAFHEYEQALKVVECEIEYISLREEQQFMLTEDVIGTINKDIDIIFLCNPNNPTGNLIQKDLMCNIIRQCEAKGIWLVVDECFMDFVEGGKDYSVLDQCGSAKHLFILKAFTKLYAMPGLRLGYGICANEEILKHMKEVSQPWNVSIPAQLAGIAALKEEDYVVESLKLIGKEKNYLRKELGKLSYKIYGSRANYLFFHTYPGLYAICLKKGILIRDCSNYLGLKEGYYRIAVKQHEENEQLIKVLREVDYIWQNQL